ncbi:(2Fe-2S) ferredoxin domain-containing protein [Cyanobacterium stanieri LEGE 03274]|uniref:(2Fe-2S) ferredoxin domain-containing protein n=1 Tax=Cyanobacterium stanieri LEGE 03274 TaxID=1828756 RepID=A0ABR9V1G1_9CHRO|nr:(2Fe-2S) ferredoxin domain-containing protein [Cyanobacterium stanieri]MBE9221717.1 (2Fe-2S) ferredoxin domain-containing protein [Cyanobacterium stanieri LEGE 03274]
MDKKPHLIVICNGRSCKKYGSNYLLEAIQKEKENNTKVITKYCFGHCGNGITVLILPEQKIYPNIRNKKELLNILNSE